MSRLPSHVYAAVVATSLMVAASQASAADPADTNPEDASTTQSADTTSAKPAKSSAGPSSASDRPDSSGSSDTSRQPGATDQTKQQRDQRYKSMTQRAAKAYRDKDYGRALDLFEQAYQLKAVPNLLYNMGRIEEKQGHFDDAIGRYETFVTKPGVDIKARKDALDRLNTLREVQSLRAKGKQADKTRVEANTSNRQLAKPAPGPPATRVEPNYTPAWVTLGVAAAAYATSGVFALQASSAYTDFENAETRPARRDAASWGQTTSIISDSALALGVVMTGVGAYFLVSPATEQVPADQSAMRVGPRLGVHGAGMAMTVDF